MTQLRDSVQPEHKSKLEILARNYSSYSHVEMPSKYQKVSCYDCRLQNSCLTKSLSANGLAKFVGVVKSAKGLRKNLYLYRQADQFVSLYFVKSGFVKSYVVDTEGNELAVSFFMPGEIIGLDGLYSKHYTSSIIALQDTSVCEIPYDALENLCAAEPELQKYFNELQSRQIVQEQKMTMLRGHKNATDRLLAFLLNMSNRYKRQKLSSLSFRLPMTRKDIGGCLGLTLETVSRVFTTLQKQELLTVNGKDVTLKNLKPSGVLSH